MQRDAFAGAIFFGHMNPDSDSVGSAIGAAELFCGFAACPMRRDKCPNRESRFVLDLFEVGLEAVPVLDTIEDYTSKPYVLVDFNDAPKGPQHTFPEMKHVEEDAGVWSSQVVGVIDHHAPQMLAPMPLYTELLPWGSASTMLAVKFLDHALVPSRRAAAALLGGILSDTLGLKSPTVTSADMTAVAWLTALRYGPSNATLLESVGLASVAELTQRMIEAKSAIDFDHLPEAFDADLKVYPTSCGPTVAIGTVEVSTNIYRKLLDQDPAQLAAAASAVKENHSAQHAFILFVDVLEFRSTLLTTRYADFQLARVAMAEQSCTHDGVEEVPAPKSDDDLLFYLSTGSCVSRKKQFQPAIIPAADERECGGH